MKQPVDTIPARDLTVNQEFRPLGDKRWANQTAVVVSKSVGGPLTRVVYRIVGETMRPAEFYTASLSSMEVFE